MVTTMLTQPFGLMLQQTRSRSIAFLLELGAILLVLYAGYSIVVHRAMQCDRCEMTVMAPAYRDISSQIPYWTPASYKYRLFAYDDHQFSFDEQGKHMTGCHCIPALYIPGSCGSYQQVRSIGSMTLKAMQLQQREDVNRCVQFYSVDFIDEFSAFSGNILEEQATFVKTAIKYIAKVHGSSKGIILIGHSFGGVVIQRALSSINSPPILFLAFCSPLKSPPLMMDFDLNPRSVEFPRNIKFVSIASGHNDVLVPSTITPDESLRIDRLKGVWTDPNHDSTIWENRLMRRLAEYISRHVRAKRLILNPAIKLDVLEEVHEVSEKIQLYCKRDNRLGFTRGQICSDTESRCFVLSAKTQELITTENVADGLKLYCASQVQDLKDGIELKDPESPIIRKFLGTTFRHKTYTDVSTSVTESVVIARCQDPSHYLVGAMECRADHLSKLFDYQTSDLRYLLSEDWKYKEPLIYSSLTSTFRSPNVVETFPITSWTLYRTLRLAKEETEVTIPVSAIANRSFRISSDAEYVIEIMLKDGRSEYPIKGRPIRLGQDATAISIVFLSQTGPKHILLVRSFWDELSTCWIQNPAFLVSGLYFASITLAAPGRARIVLCLFYILLLVYRSFSIFSAVTTVICQSLISRFLFHVGNLFLKSKVRHVNQLIRLLITALPFIATLAMNIRNLILAANEVGYLTMISHFKSIDALFLLPLRIYLYYDCYGRGTRPRDSLLRAILCALCFVILRSDLRLFQLELFEFAGSPLIGILLLMKQQIQ